MKHSVVTFVCGESYSVSFENDKGETIEMSGKWKGAFNKGSKVTYILKDIK